MDALKAEYLETSSRVRRDEINAELAQIARENPQEAGSAFAAQLDESVAELRTQRIRDMLGPVSEAINWAYVARTYFGKSRGWLYQRLNGNIHNGAVARFSATEAAILEDALWDIAEKIRGVKIAKVE